MSFAGRTLRTSPWALTVLSTLPVLGLSALFSPAGVQFLEREPDSLDRILSILFLVLALIPVWTGWANRLLLTPEGDVLLIRTGMVWPLPQRQALPRASLASVTIVSRELGWPLNVSLPSDFLALRLADGRLLRLSPMGTRFLTGLLRHHGEALAVGLQLPMEQGQPRAPDDFWA